MATRRDARIGTRRANGRRLRSRLAPVVLPVVGVTFVVGAMTAAVVADSDDTMRQATGSLSATEDIITRAMADESGAYRSAERPDLADAVAALVEVEGTLVALKDGVAVHADASTSSAVLATLKMGERVQVSGKTRGEWTEIVRKDLSRWVRSDQVASRLPLGEAPCPSGSGVERGLKPDTVKVHRAVCALFPQIRSYGGIAGRGEHATGHSLDIMVSPEVGNQVAAFLQENRAKLGIEYLIWRQRIWRPSTSGAWRGMKSRGGATANHMDHVHVTTYGNAATR